MKITCPECSIQFDVANTLAVKKAKCGECGFVFHVPVNQSGAAHQAGWNGVTENEQPIARAWLSLYVAGITVLLLLLRSNISDFPGNWLLAIVVESAAIFLLYRSWRIVWPLRKSGLHQHTIQMAIIIHGVLLGIFALSLTITLYALIFMRTTTSLSHVGGLEQLMKSVQEMNKLLPK